MADRLRRLPRVAVGAVGLAGMVVMAWADWVTGPHISFSVFYILPLAVVAWFAGKWWALVLAVFGAAFTLVNGLHESAAGISVFAAIWNATARLLLFLIVLLSMDRLRRLNDRLTDLAHLDPLTGVQNARSFEQTAQRHLHAAIRDELPVTLGYIDLDDFKQLNDHFGHAKGDEALRLVAEAIQRGIRDGDSVARLGGDEFVVLLPGSDVPTAMAIMERLRDRIRESMTEHGMRITVSIGVAQHDPDEELDDLVKGADAHMYLAKRSGKDQVAAPAVSSRRAG